MVKDLILQNRSYRRFEEDYEITKDTLVEMVDYARRTASASNKQPLRYFVSNEKEMNEKINSCLGWAGYLNDWAGPEEGERPSAYIVILSESELNSSYDEGIVGQSLLLMAAEMGLGGCMLLNVKREDLKKLLNLPKKYFVKMVIALGKPKEQVVLEEIPKDGDVRYYRDENGVHHVPKIRLADVLVN